ncbi:MAG TPA: L-threonylcarbamoyladenylate synthase [Dehalococcoidia bacterium]|nr:L-threonylcarbamoyladenylate synthase [Dehalococcoidia bacterium]
MSNVIEAESGVALAVEKLKEGGVVAFPTDTLYALAADATNPAAVERVFDVKGREGGKPLPLFVSGLEMAARYGQLTPEAEALARRYWPGALTLVVKRRPDFESAALAGGDTVALRAPDHPVALAVVKGLGKPVTGTSANLSGGPEPVTARDVLEALGEAVDLVLDGGACPKGRPSTIVDCTVSPPVVLREGAIPPPEIAAATGAPASR